MKKSYRALLALLLGIMLILTSCASGTETPAPATDGGESVADSGDAGIYTPGTYSATAAGHNADLTLSVTFSDSAITDIAIGDHQETAGVADPALERIPAAILDGQTLAVDTVSGATVTSGAILAAVEDCVSQAGGDVNALKNPGATETATSGETVTRESEVIVIGAGGAGLAAAVKLGELDTECIVIEKMSAAGGNTARSGAAYNAVDPELQGANDIEDSIELHIQQTYDGGDQIGRMELIEILCNNALESIKWLESYGTPWQDTITAVIGATWPRTHYPENSIGSDFTTPLLSAATEQFNQEVLVDTEATALIVEDGRVVGVKAVSTVDGTEYEFMATKGVIVASGGFGADIERCRQYNPNIPADITSSNSPGATGDGIDMAVAIGAALESIEYIQMLPIGSGPTVSTVIDDLIFVNSEGNRFVREDGRRDQMSNAILEQPGQYMYMINDQRVVDDGVSQHGIDERLERGDIYRADTLEELAEQIGVNAENLVKSVEEFNAYVASGGPDEFDREVFSRTIEVGPFWASAQQKPVIHHTMGGIRIDTQSRVLNEQDEPIPGLYAAGEVCGGIHGANRLGGNALPDVFIFGRIAAESVAEGV